MSFSSPAFRHDGSTVRACRPGQPGGVSSGFEPYPLAPAHLMREVLWTPPTGSSDAEALLHRLRVDVQPETTVCVEARLADGHSRWALLHTRSQLLVAHRQD